MAEVSSRPSADSGLSTTWPLKCRSGRGRPGGPRRCGPTARRDTVAVSGASLFTLSLSAVISTSTGVLALAWSAQLTAPLSTARVAMLSCQGLALPGAASAAGDLGAATGRPLPPAGVRIQRLNIQRFSPSRSTRTFAVVRGEAADGQRARRQVGLGIGDLRSGRHWQAPVLPCVNATLSTETLRAWSCRFGAAQVMSTWPPSLPSSVGSRLLAR